MHWYLENIISSFLVIASLIKRVSSLIFISLVLSYYIHAQDNQIRFKHISLEQGLSQSTVFSIVQDSVGFMWFATRDGLNKYDGYNFTVYRPDPLDSNSISDTGIRRLLVDSRGYLWIITLTGKVDRFDQKHDTFDHYNLITGNLPKTQPPIARCIVQDFSDNIWIGTVEGTLYRFDWESDLFIRQQFNANEENNINNIHLQSMYADKSSSIWMGTWEGLVRYDCTSGPLVRYQNISSDPQSLGGNAIFGITEDSGGNLWVASADGGVSVLDNKRDRFKVFRQIPDAPNSISSNRVFCVFADVRSNIWIGTADAGLDMYDPYNGVFKNYTHDPALQSSLSIGVVTCFFEDRSGALWIGTTNGGINRIDWKQQDFFNITHIANDPASLNRSTILALCEDRTGALWVGTAGGGLSRRLFGQNKFEHYLQLPHEFISNTITAVYEDRQGTIWIGTDPGVGTSAGTVMMFDRKLNTFKPRTDISPGVAGIGVFYEDNRGELWIGTNFDGVRRLDPQRKEVITYKYDKHNSNSISGNRVMTICEDNKGILWFGTYGSGLNRYDPATDRFTCYRNDPLDPNSLSNNAVWCIVADSNGYLWMGTWGGGLNKFLPEEESFQRFTINDGLPSNVVVGILADNAGNLWLSTNNGLCKFNTSTYACKNYDRSDGLQSDEFIQGAYCTGKDGRLYFGGTNGITAFYPDSIKNNPNVPPIVLTKFSVFDKQLSLSQPINLTREITLSYQQNFFSFEFAALDYTAPEKNQYTHKLEGIDEDWVYRGNRNFASYTDIAPGKYVFRVKGSNNDGVWSKKDAVVSIIITPPFWLTWWFKAIVVLLILNVLYAIHRYRVNKLLAVERTRVRIAKDLHDEVSATITGISYFSDAISKEVGSNKTPMLQKLFSLVKESVDQVQESMSDIIWSINPENDRWETILPKFRRYASDLCESKNIKYEISIPASIPGKDLSMEKRHNFWLIFKEMVTNAVKHSGCSEMIIAITSDNKQLILNIKDNGKGFDPEKPTDRNGVKNIKSRSAATGGKVELNTIPGKGTEWKLVIQL